MSEYAPFVDVLEGRMPWAEARDSWDPLTIEGRLTKQAAERMVQRYGSRPTASGVLTVIANRSGWPAAERVRRAMVAAGFAQEAA